jgi:hypothetical protein
MDYSNLETLAINYKSREKEKYVAELLDDLNIIIQLNDWEVIRQSVIENGMKNLNHEKLKEMVNLLFKEMSTQ